MEILDGDMDGMKAATALVLGKPHPAHMAEYRIVSGERETIAGMVSASLEASAIASYAVREGEAIIAGVALSGWLKHQIWMLATAEAKRFPKWMLREGKRMLGLADKFFGWPCSFVQVIPASYPEGLNYARHLGFREMRRQPAPHARKEEIVIMERIVPRWAR